MMSRPERYTPGVCNLGNQERQFRIGMGILGCLVAVGFAIWLVLSDSPIWQRSLVFFPAFVGALGLLQGRRRFCVAYGFLGVFNTGFGAGQVAKIEDLQQRNADRQAAISIILQSVGIAVVVTILTLFLKV